MYTHATQTSRRPFAAALGGTPSSGSVAQLVAAARKRTRVAATRLPQRRDVASLEPSGAPRCIAAAAVIVAFAVHALAVVECVIYSEEAVGATI